jgi:hypothetical protein
MEQSPLCWSWNAEAKRISARFKNADKTPDLIVIVRVE